MKILHYSPERLENLYGIRARLLTISDEPVYMGSMQGLLAPGESTHCHAHHDEEQFIIISGMGIIQNHEQQITVSSGDVIYFNPGENHQLINKHPTQDLLFASSWWAFSSGAIINKTAQTSLPQKQQIIISPPPTPNGDLHLGHLAGPYLAADILRRYLLQTGHQVSYFTGSDDHQSYVTLKAKRSQKSEQIIADYYANDIKQTLENYAAAPEYFYRPLHDQSYQQFVQHFFVKLFKNGAIRPQAINFAYCEACQRWLYEAHLSGNCQYCDSPCGGGSCETCAMPNDGTALNQAFCKYCQNTPTIKSLEVLSFDLQDFAKPLQNYINQLSLPSHIRALIRQIFAQPLPKMAITHPAEWGISLPISGFEQQKLCTWSEMAPAYLHCINQAKTDLPQELTLFFGFDNSFFYTVLLPSLFIAYDPDIKLPDNIIYNEFYLFEKEKFSTSREHAVWAHEIIQYVNSDYLRYYLAATRPETERTCFSYRGFIELINQDLAKELSGWILDLTNRLERDFQNICPDGGQWAREHTEFCAYLQEFIVLISQAYSPLSFSPATIIRLLRELVSRAKKLAASNQHLAKLNPSNLLEYQTGIVLELTAVKYYALASYPIMPNFAQRLAAAIGLSENLNWHKECRLLPKNSKISGLAECRFMPLNLSQLQLAGNTSYA